MIVLIIIIAFLMIVGAIAMFSFPSNIVSAVMFGLISLGSTVLFLIMQAPDVAITEAAIGVLLSSVVVIYAIKRIEENNEEK